MKVNIENHALTYKTDDWIEKRLSEEEMNFLWSAISEENKEDLSRELAGNISKSEIIQDKDNWFYETVLKELSENLFYRDWDNYYEYCIAEKKSPPKFEMNTFWVNYQKKHEFNPPHNHNGAYSFVVFMKIPTHWKDQHALPISANSNTPRSSDFVFVQPDPIDKRICISTPLPLSPEDEGRMLFFPAFLQHQVFPFYECEEERITISGNVYSVLEKIHGQEASPGPRKNTYEEKENMLRMMENSVRIMKEELKRSVPPRATEKKENN